MIVDIKKYYCGGSGAVRTIRTFGAKPRPVLIQMQQARHWMGRVWFDTHLSEITCVPICKPREDAVLMVPVMENERNADYDDDDDGEAANVLVRDRTGQSPKRKDAELVVLGGKKTAEMQLNGGESSRGKRLEKSVCMSGVNWVGKSKVASCVAVRTRGQTSLPSRGR